MRVAGRAEKKPTVLYKGPTQRKDYLVYNQVERGSPLAGIGAFI